MAADAKNDVLGNQAEQPGLNHIENCRQEAQREGQNQQGCDVEIRAVPGFREQPVDRSDRKAGTIEQYLINQHGEQQGNRYRSQGGENGHELRHGEFPPMRQDDALDVGPVNLDQRLSDW